MQDNDVNNEEKTSIFKSDSEIADFIEEVLNEEDTVSPVKMELFDWIQCVVSAVVCGIFIFVFVGRIIGVEQTSMLPTLYNEDRVIMSNLFYTPKNGDIVIFKTEEFGETPLVKRVIATEGQTIDINFETGAVTVDGEILEEPYINALTAIQRDFTGPVTVPEGHMFVMGDNRNASTDSRDDSVGMVDTRTVLGKVLVVIIPGKDAQGKRDWSRIGSVYS